MPAPPSTPVWQIHPDLLPLTRRELPHQNVLDAGTRFVPRPHYNWGNDRFGTFGGAGGNNDATGLIIGMGSANTAQFYAAGPGQTTGKWYFEARCNSFTGVTTIAIGAGTNAYGFAGTGTTGFVYTLGTDALTFNGTTTSALLSGAPAANDWLGFAVDLGNNKVWVRNITKGGGWRVAGQPEANSGGVTISGHTGNWQPGALLTTSALENNVATFNFGATGFVGDVPQGFVTWPGLFTLDTPTMVTPAMRDITGRQPLPPSVAIGDQSFYMRTPGPPIAATPTTSITAVTCLAWALIQPPVSTISETQVLFPTAAPVVVVRAASAVFPNVIPRSVQIPPGTVGPVDFTQFIPSSIVGTPSTAAPDPVFPDIILQRAQAPPPVARWAADFTLFLPVATPNTAPPVLIFPDAVRQNTQIPAATGAVNFTFFVPTVVIPSTVPPQPVFPDAIRQNTQIPPGTLGPVDFTQFIPSSIVGTPSTAPPQPVFPDAIRLSTQVPQGMVTQYWATPQFVPLTEAIFPDRVWHNLRQPLGTLGPVDFTQFVPSSIVGTPSRATPQPVFPDRVWQQPITIPPATGSVNFTFYPPTPVITPSTASPQPVWPDRVWQSTLVPQGFTTQFWGTPQSAGTPVPTTSITFSTSLAWNAILVPQSFTTQFWGTKQVAGTPSTAPPQPVFPDRVWQSTQVPQGFITQYWATPQFVPLTEAIFPDRVWQPVQLPPGITTGSEFLFNIPSSIVATQAPLPPFPVFPDKVWQQPQLPPVTTGPADYTFFVPSSIVATPTTAPPAPVFPDAIRQNTQLPPGTLGPVDFTLFVTSSIVATPSTAAPQPVFPDLVWQPAQIPNGFITQYWATPQVLRANLTKAIFPDFVWQEPQIPQATGGIDNTLFVASSIVATPTTSPPAPIFPERVWQEPQVPQGFVTQYWATPQFVPLTEAIFPERVWQPTAIPPGTVGPVDFTQFIPSSIVGTPTTFTAGIFPDRPLQASQLPPRDYVAFYNATTQGRTTATATTPVFATYPSRVETYPSIIPEGMTVSPNIQPPFVTTIPTTFTAGIFPDRVWQQTSVPQGMVTFFSYATFTRTPTTSVTSVMVVPWEPIKPPPGVPEFADYTLIPPPPVRTTPTSFTAGIFQPFVWRPTLVPNGTGPASFTLFPFAFTPTNRGPPTAIFPELIRQAVSIIPQTINSVSFALVPHVRTPTSFTTAITVSSPLPWGKILVPQSSTGIVWSPIYAVLIPFHHSGVQRIEWAIKRKIEWIVAKQIVEQVYDRDLQWMHNLDFESMYPAQRAAMIDTIAQSIEMHYLVSKGMLLTDCYAMIDEIKKERQQRDDEEAIIHLLDDE